MAGSVLGTPTNLDGGSTYTAEAGSNRILVISLSREASGTGVTPDVSTLSFGTPSLANGQIISAIEVAQNAGNRMRAGVWYIKEANIPVGAQTLAATWSTTMAGTADRFTCYTLADIDQTTPVGATDTIAPTGSTPLNDTLAVAAGTVQVCAAGNNNNNGGTPMGTFVEIQDISDGAGTSRIYSHYNVQAAADTIAWGVNLSQSGAAVVASFSPLSQSNAPRARFQEMLRAA